MQHAMALQAISINYYRLQYAQLRCRMPILVTPCMHGPAIKIHESHITNPQLNYRSGKLFQIQRFWRRKKTHDGLTIQCYKTTNDCTNEHLF